MQRLTYMLYAVRCQSNGSIQSLNVWSGYKRLLLNHTAFTSELRYPPCDLCSRLHQDWRLTWNKTEYRRTKFVEYKVIHSKSWQKYLSKFMKEVSVKSKNQSALRQIKCVWNHLLRIKGHSRNCRQSVVWSCVNNNLSLHIKKRLVKIISKSKQNFPEDYVNCRDTDQNIWCIHLKHQDETIV